MKYRIDANKTLDTLSERNLFYRNAIENCKSLSHLTKILEGFNRLTGEYAYVDCLLDSTGEVLIKRTNLTAEFKETAEIAKKKSLELYFKDEVWNKASIFSQILQGL